MVARDDLQSLTRKRYGQGAAARAAGLGGGRQPGDDRTILV